MEHSDELINIYTHVFVRDCCVAVGHNEPCPCLQRAYRIDDSRIVFDVGSVRARVWAAQEPHTHSKHTHALSSVRMAPW